MVPLYRGWSVVVACGIIATFSWGLGFYGLGVYLHALSRLHGWSAGLISAAVTVYYAVSAGCIVLVGTFIDRHGPRGLLTYGVVSMAVAVAALGIVAAPWQLFVVYLLLATSWSCLSLTGISSTILPWFGRRQGVAMTLALTGASVGGMVLVPVLVALVLRHGFAFATMAAGLTSLVICLPLVLFVIRGRPTPEEVAGELARHGATGPEDSLLEPSLGESRAALTVSATTVAALLGRVVLGVLSDRMDLRDLSACNIGAQGVALAVMAAWPSPGVFVAGSLVFGLGVGNLITLPPLLAREEFGQRSFGTVFGLVAGTVQIGVALGPGLTGVLHDALDSYQPVLWCLVGLEAVAVASVLWGKTLRAASANGRAR